ncbi:uncharacterized protein LOC100208037 isoform X1 [Hydra vulgaris]|uniref:uncharacterized protein LOC100208037 isoform X1 n=1 Tax=Hydra vulgaris TaxID=6087 RepID=UPI001F5FDDCC|nr:uncharacterized protein LOC100208037 [Hydra vulgaris]
MEFVQPNKKNENSDLEKIANFLTRNQDKIDKYDREVLNQLKIEVQRDCSSKNCNECLSKMQYYFVASNRYEILALHLVGLYELILQSITFVTSKNDYNSLKRRIETKSSDRKMFLDYLLNQKRSSSYNVQEWKCVAEYYKYPGKFEFIDFFVKYSAENTESGASLIVYVGKDENFDEYNSYIAEEKKEVNLKISANYKDTPWLSELRWIFVPPKCQVTLYPDNKEAKKVDMTSNSIEIKGPTLVQVPKITYKVLYIQRSEQLSGEYIRICKKPKMEGACFQLEPKNLNSQQSITMLFPAESLYIPSGWKVNMRTSGFFNTEKNFINIKGPLTLEYICREGLTLVELSGFSNANPPKNEVKICSEINFGGWCDYIDTKFDKNVLHSCDWKNIRSFEIPKSKEMKVKTDCLLSCFRGPDIAGYTKSSSDTEITKILSVSVVSFNVKKSQF